MLFEHGNTPMVSVGNVFHTVMVGHNNSLKIKPFYIRLLMGAMSSIMYMLFFLISLKRQPIFKFNYLTACFVIGYFVEIILEKTEEILPNIIDKISTILLGGNYEKNNNHFFSHITMWLSNHK